MNDFTFWDTPKPEIWGTYTSMVHTASKKCISNIWVEVVKELFIGASLGRHKNLSREPTQKAAMTSFNSLRARDKIDRIVIQALRTSKRQQRPQVNAVIFLVALANQMYSSV